MNKALLLSVAITLVSSNACYKTFTAEEPERSRLHALPARKGTEPFAILFAQQATTESAPPAGKIAHQASEMTLPTVPSPRLTGVEVVMPSGTETCATETILRLGVSSTEHCTIQGAVPTITQRVAVSALQTAPRA